MGALYIGSKKSQNNRSKKDQNNDSKKNQEIAYLKISKNIIYLLIKKTSQNCIQKSKLYLLKKHSPRFSGVKMIFPTNNAVGSFWAVGFG